MKILVFLVPFLASFLVSGSIGYIYAIKILARFKSNLQEKTILISYITIYNVILIFTISQLIRLPK